jgi:hypothetical protein
VNEDLNREIGLLGKKAIQCLPQIPLMIVGNTADTHEWRLTNTFIPEPLRTVLHANRLPQARHYNQRGF